MDARRRLSQQQRGPPPSTADAAVQLRTRPQQQQQPEFLIGYPSDYGLPTAMQQQQQQQLGHPYLLPIQAPASNRRHSAAPSPSPAAAATPLRNSFCQQQLDPSQLQQLPHHHHLFLTLQKPRQQVLPDEKYPTPEPSSTASSLHLYQSLPHQSFHPAYVQYPVGHTSFVAMPPIFSNSSSSKKEVGVGTTQDVHLVEQQQPKGDPIIQMEQKGGDQAPSSIGAPLSAGGLSFTGNDVEKKEVAERGEAKEPPPPSSQHLLAPLAEMEGASSLESAASTLAASSEGGRNGGANQSDPSSSESHQSKEESLSIGVMGSNDGGGEEEKGGGGCDGRVEEDDLEAVGEKAMRIYKELDEAFNSLDKGEVDGK